MVAVDRLSLFAAPSTSHAAHPSSLTAVLTGVVAHKAILAAVPEGAAQRPILSAAPPTAVLAGHIAADRGSAARADQQEKTRFLFQPLRELVVCSTSVNRSLLFAQKRRLNPEMRDTRWCHQVGPWVSRVGRRLDRDIRFMQ